MKKTKNNSFKQFLLVRNRNQPHVFTSKYSARKVRRKSGECKINHRIKIAQTKEKKDNVCPLCF